MSLTLALFCLPCSSLNVIISVVADLQAKNAETVTYEWKDIKTATANDANAIPGIYQWIKSTAPGDKPSFLLIHYKDVTTESDAFDDTGKLKLNPKDNKFEIIAADPSLPIDENLKCQGTNPLGAGTQINCEELSVTFTDKTYCNGDLVIYSADDVNIIDPNNNVIPLRPIINFTTTTEEGTLLTAEGSLFLDGEVKGCGVLAAKNNVTLQGSSELACPLNDDNLAIYAGNNVNLKPITAVTMVDANNGFDIARTITTPDEFKGLTSGCGTDQYYVFTEDEVLQHIHRTGSGQSYNIDGQGKELIANRISQ